MNKLIAISALVLGFGLGAWSGHKLRSAETSASVAHADIPTPVKREPCMWAGRADSDSDVLRALIRGGDGGGAGGEDRERPRSPYP